MTRARDVVVHGADPVELRPGQRPRVIRVAVLPDDKGLPKSGPLGFVQGLQIAELGAHVLAVERSDGGFVAAVCPAGSYPVVLTPGDILGSIP